MEEDRVVASLLGTAIGDAKGIPFETMKRDEVQSLSTSVLTGVYTPITKENPYIPLDWPPGRWTDDTQLTLAVARGLKSGRGFNMDAMVPEHIAELKASSYGWGSSTKGSIQRIVDGTHTWENSGNVKGSGNGVLMKISPLALYWAAVYGPGKNVPQKVQQMSQLARMTHASSRSVCIALTWAMYLERIFYSKQPQTMLATPAKRKELLQFAWGVANQFETGILPVAGEEPIENDDKLSTRIAMLLSCFDALTDSTIVSIARGGTSNAVDSLSLVLGVLSAEAPSFASIQRAVLLGGDTDSNASMVGGVVGFCCGRSAFPLEYISGLYKATDIIAEGVRFSRFLSSVHTHDSSNRSWLEYLPKSPAAIGVTTVAALGVLGLFVTRLLKK